MSLDNTTFKYFIVGSSLPVTFITLIYNGMAFARSGRPSDVPFEYFPIVVLLLFGIANVLMYRFGKLNPALGTKWWYPFIVGGVTGLTFSFIGRFGFDLPRKIFGFSKETAYNVHLIAPLLYALIFGIIVTKLNKVFI